MFVRYFVDIPMPFERAERALLTLPEFWLPGIAREADDHGERLLFEIGFGTGARVHKQVEVKLREPIKTRNKTLIPLSWTATGASGLFPSLEADLELGGMGPARSQLSLSARYRPPLGSLGEVVDRALLHRVAEATIRDFVQRAAASLEHSAANSLLGEANSV